MIEINEELFFDELDISRAIVDVGQRPYSRSGNFLRYANEQLYAQMMGWC